MANIRVDSNSTVYNGQTITFKSPANCSNVTGLKVYYQSNGKEVSKTFQFADAHGNNVGSVDLFAANVLVKVILDTDLNRAYVQNADTNAYLEKQLAGKALINHTHDSDDIYRVGDIFTTIRTDLGDNWLACNGDTITSEDYPELCSLDSLRYHEVSIGSNHNSTKIYCYNHVWLTASTYTNSNTLVTTDPAGTWSELSQGLGFVDIAYYNGTYVGLTRDGKVYSTKTPTDTWTLVHNFETYNHVYHAICCYNGTYAVLSTTTGSTATTYYVSNATGLSGTWQTTTVGTVDTASSGKETMCCYEGTWVISCAANHIFVTTNILSSWTQKEVRVDSNTNGFHTDIACHEGTWAIVGGGYCWSTNNPLGDWEHTFLGVSANSVQYNEDKWVIAATQNSTYPAIATAESPIGIWKSTILGSAGAYLYDVAFDGDIMTALNSSARIYTTGIRKLPDDPFPNSNIFTYIKAK